MRITLDLSLYPLTAQYEDEILEFIRHMEQSGLKPEVNALSTQIQGEYPFVWNEVGEAISKSFSRGTRAGLVIKVLPGDINLNYKHQSG